MFISIISWMTIGVLLKVNGHNSSDQGFHRCGSEEHLEYALSHDPGMRGRLDAIEEHWRQNPNHDGHQIDLRRRLQTLPSPLVIPINFLITKGPSDPYIGYEQIISQIRALNIDYQGSNPDKGQNGRGSTSEFSNKAGNFNIRFSLNKIKRKDTTKQGFDNVDMMSESTGGQSNEDPEHALNFWVNSPPSGSNTLGWTFGPGVDWQYDGIVQRPDVVGSKAYDRNNQWTLHGVYNLGRTATHEIGHWLNLVHIWGPGASGCGSANDDLVSDTPDQEKAHGGCPADGTNSCGTNDMYMNFMDYSNDNCMNMFTIGQIDRGDDLFLAGGHRVKLLDYVSNPTDVAFIDYFYFVNGNGAKCDNGHTRRDLNLNEGAGGDYIYLCISYSHNPYVDVITDIYILSGGSNAISCNSGYEKIDSNLNEDAGGDHIYLCYKKESRQASSPIITDLYPFAFDSAYSSSTYNGYTLESVNLNKGTGGKYIYLGSKGKSPLSSINLNWTKLDGKLNHISIGSDGTIIGTASDSSIWKYTGGAPQWTKLSGGLKQISVRNANEYWGVNTADEIWRNINGVWQKINGGLKHVSVGSDGTVWGVNNGNEIFKYNGNNGWTKIVGGLIQISVASATQIAGVNSGGELFKYNGNTNSWTLINANGLKFKYVDIQSNGDLYTIGYGDDDGIYFYNGISGQWSKVSGGAEQIEMDSGKVVCVNGNDEIWTAPAAAASSAVSIGNMIQMDDFNEGLKNKGNGQSGAKSVHEHVSYHRKKYNNGDSINMNMYYGQDDNNKQSPNYHDWMDGYHSHDKHNYNNINNNDMNGIEISTNMFKLIISGLMIINMICLGIYCMDNNKCNYKLNKKQRGYKVVKYESEDTEV